MIIICVYRFSRSFLRRALWPRGLLFKLGPFIDTITSLGLSLDKEDVARPVLFPYMYYMKKIGETKLFKYVIKPINMSYH